MFNVTRRVETFSGLIDFLGIIALLGLGVTMVGLFLYWQQYPMIPLILLIFIFLHRIH